ncbi:MAG: hypothetical protein HY431_02435 [Candidatus Levybacteria bacterium]|nr:hypothetical protein [Candidatus Levybacteria bacterium]
MAGEQIGINPVEKIVPSESIQSPLELRPVDRILRGPFPEEISRGPDAARLGVWFKVIFPGLAWDASQDSMRRVLEQDVKRIKDYSEKSGLHWPQDAAYYAALLKAFSGYSPFTVEETDTALNHLSQRVVEDLDRPHLWMTVDGNTNLAVHSAVAYRVLSNGRIRWTDEHNAKMLDYLERFTTEYLGYYHEDTYLFMQSSDLIGHIARSQASHLILNAEIIRFTPRGIEVL